MPAVVGDMSVVALSFANNFWGKDDAGVGPLLLRMQAAKQTCDELKSFYSTRASIEDEYARKLLSLCKKPFGSQEMGGLKLSMDTVRGEVEAMAKQHQNIAAQMKSELDEPLSAFAGAMKERRKIVQNGIEKLLKTKMQQTQQVNKTRDKYEQECLKIKGYLAQGHMVMGQEERKNKAKLEKTQLALAASNADYENAVKILEETTARWNREWKAAADKFQDLEEERLDFTKSSLWAFANIASTVCVSDDASCEKIRLSLEKMDVGKDIVSFITEKGTGQEIPDPPKYINFSRGDTMESTSDASEDENFSVAQFPRSINPAFRTTSPQPSAYESHHRANALAAKEAAESHIEPASSRSAASSQQPDSPALDNEQLAQYQGRLPTRQELSHAADPGFQQEVVPASLPQSHSTQLQRQTGSNTQISPQTQSRPVAISGQHTPGQQPQALPISNGPHSSHEHYPSDSTAAICRTGQPAEINSKISPGRPPSPEFQEPGDYSHQTSFSSMEQPGASGSPVKQLAENPGSSMAEKDKRVMKKRSGFFQSHSPFRRKSTKERDAISQPPNPQPQAQMYHQQQSQVLQSQQQSPPKQVQRIQSGPGYSPQPQQQQQQPQQQQPRSSAHSANEFKPPSVSNRNTWTALPSASHQQPSAYHKMPQQQPEPSPSRLITSGRDVSPDPIDANATLALGVGPNVLPVSADSGNGKIVPLTKKDNENPIAMALADLKNSPVGGKPSSSRVSVDRYAGISTPAPGLSANSSIQAAKRGTPPPSYDQQVQRLGAPPPAHTARAMKEASEKYVGQTRSIFGDTASYSSSSLPRSGTRQSTHGDASPRRNSREEQRTSYRSTSPSTHNGNLRSSSRVSAHNNSMNKRSPEQSYYRPGTSHSMRGSPAEHYSPSRPGSSHVGGDMSMQLASPSDINYTMQLEQPGSRPGSRPGTSNSSRAMGLYEGPSQVGNRQRSKSVADGARQFSRDGRPILHFARAMYTYQAAIPEELGFHKGDTLAVLQHQDDGWWEAEVHGAGGRVGLVPSNYLQAI